MPEQNDNTGELDQPYIILDVIFVAHHQSTKVVKPGKESLDFPPSLEPAQRPTILRFVLRSASLSMWRDHFGAILIKHFSVEPVTVVSFVTNQLLRNICHETLLQGLGDQLHFSRASTLCAYGDRKTMAVRD